MCACSSEMISEEHQVETQLDPIIRTVVPLQVFIQLFTIHSEVTLPFLKFYSISLETIIITLISPQSFTWRQVLTPHSIEASGSLPELDVQPRSSSFTQRLSSSSFGHQKETLEYCLKVHFQVLEISLRWEAQEQ